MSIEAKIADPSALSRARNERFRDAISSAMFLSVSSRCLAGLVGGDGFAIDASLILADANT